MPETYETLKRTDDGPVATVALARPDARNALNAALIQELARCFGELASDGAVRAVVLTGEGRSFCAGADIGYMREITRFSYEENVADARRLAAAFAAVDGCPKPVVAKVRGAAIGSGVGLVAAADVAVATRGTVFAFPEVRLGISPAVISPFVVRKIGHSHARALFLTGERFDAALAREMGLVHEVVAEGLLDEAVEKITAQLLAGGPEALAATKGLLRDVWGAAPGEVAEKTAWLIAELRTGEEGHEGLGAFLEKREPSWRARP